MFASVKIKEKKSLNPGKNNISLLNILKCRAG